MQSKEKKNALFRKKKTFLKKQGKLFFSDILCRTKVSFTKRHAGSVNNF